MFSKFARALAILVFAACGATGAAVDDSSNLLRERVEELRAGRLRTIEGATIAEVTAVTGLYESLGFRLAWTDPAKPVQLIASIRASAGDGLNPEDYHLSILEALSARMSVATEASSAARVDFDLVLTDALARLGDHVLFGKVDYARFDPVWNFRPEYSDLDPPRALRAALESPDLSAVIDRAKPSHAAYSRLKLALAQYRAIDAAGGWPTIPPGPALRPGASGARVRAVRRRLEVTGELATASAGDDYDEPLRAAVVEFQRRHSLVPDGILGAGTLRELNVPVQARIAQLRVNLERARWLLRDIGDEFVVVNVAGFHLYYFDDGQLKWETDVQVGKPYRSTPVFRSKLTYLVLNPTWTVPHGIFANDLLPELKRDAQATLARKDLRVVDAKGNAVDAASINWSKATARNFPYYLRQDSGPDNALGRVKFMFPNKYSVYLHDTPHKELFGSSERAFSSGCIRVADPLRLAELLLRTEAGWDRAAIDAAVATGKLRSVSLSRPVPVLLSYWTAWVQDGTLRFCRDLYGRDAKVLEGLDAGFRLR